MNLSQQKRKKMLEFLDKLKVDNNGNEENLIAINEIVNALNGKKYGLVWEEHEEQVDVMMKDNVPVFTEISKLEIKNNDNIFDFLLEGDNLHSLYLLEKTHKNMIDMIYIDPPYNTGNKDFKYDDTFIDIEDSYVHSKWLSFMKKRLEIAYELLKDDGVIFISIDDNELYNLKLLCDDIFGSSNFIANIALEISKTQGMKVKAAQSGQMVKNHEYVLFYCKNIEYNINRKPLYDIANPYDQHFNKVLIKNGSEYNEIPISDYIKNNYVDVFSLFEKYNLISKGKISPDKISKGIIIDDTIKELFYNKLSDIIYQEMACSINVPEDIDKKLDSGKIVEYDKYLLAKSSGGKIRQYRNLKETLNNNDEYNSEYSRVTIRGALWKGFYSDMMNVAKEGKVEFKNGKKPVRLIKQLAKYVNRKNAIILDFFAGSGTTGQAVFELNNEDDGNRHYILCTNNENNICEEVTYKRLENIILDGKENNEKCKNTNLKYYKTDFVSKKDGNLCENLTKHIKELIQLENGVDIDNDKYFILLTDEDVEKLENNIGKYKNIKGIYRSREIMFTTKQKKLFNNIKDVIIPDYYFNSELKEVGENW